ncbi:probable galacturonosyltransferase 4 [Chenopodium quinoa]|uniref:probable galacturonosyltransferase 4 n=1 Tax=Chenopodium quinoa TaxID=63459 RepID=UPI000B788372|nr:probable galacturonosyltransferase 4 [Chenopodium quinoa]
MKLKMGFRKPVLCLLFITVVSPILLYTDKLGILFPSFSSEELDGSEEISTFAFTGRTGQLNVLPQENEMFVKEPVGIVYSHKSSKLKPSMQDGKVLEVQPVEVEHKNRILSTTTTSSGSNSTELENPIRQVTDVNEVKGVDGLQMVENADVNVNAKDNDPSHLASNNLETKPKMQSVEKGGNVGTRETANRGHKNEKNGNQVDSVSNTQVRYLKDQLIRAKVYLSLTATRSNAHFIRELRQRIKEVQRAVGDATKDSDLPRNAHEKLRAMDQTLAMGKQIQDDCAALVKKLRAILHSTEEQLRVHRKQTMFLTQLTAKTLPKGLHCLPLRLSTEFYALNYSQQQFPYQEKLDDPQLYHYALFSDNVLAAAVVVNSTVSHAKDPSRHVFHIVTDRLNYAAMRMWFLVNPPSNAAIHVQNVEEFTWLNSSYSPVLKQLGSPSMIDYYFKTHRAASDSNLKFRNPKYLSILNHLRFYLPEIFPKLNKVLFLDDDIVVQKDLTRLWSIDLRGNVNGAVETCGETFHRFDRYLNFSNPLISKNFDPHACGWAYGMNIFDLEEWKRQNITEVYHNWQKLNHDRQLWKLGTLPPGLITFWKRTYPLHRSWHVLGLGYNPSVNTRDIEKAAVVHYNGNMKPWLEIGMPKYRGYWSKYIDYDQVYMRECNINP